ncbi:hypothetical protein CEN46_08960 [Fischerella thermalis CCMEE 5318]|uniref:Uncharacterized protein n=1 Tax=Fischerella thermalis CCMEE 5318 TaxID=2019666 RepID=A0A2N6LIJ0_9CYAN|nr:hypothetical protein CEN46_08960 [Fischerella thermalis CCMEE 5318]
MECFLTVIQFKKPKDSALSLESAAANGGFDLSFAQKLVCTRRAMARLYIWWNNGKSSVRGDTPLCIQGSLSRAGLGRSVLCLNTNFFNQMMELVV